MKRVPFQDLTRLHRSCDPELSASLQATIASSTFVGGAAVASFESEFAQVHNAEFGVGCGSGTDALVLALRALGIGAGDEVVVPAMTFVATAEAVVLAGATPVLTDVDSDTLLLTSELVEAVTTDSTKAVIPVHLYGHVVPVPTMQAWRDQGLVVVEDACQAHLATYDGASVGKTGNAAAFSFYPGKNLGALGDGGLILTDDPGVASRTRSLRDHGSSRRYHHDEIGYCSRLDGIQAAVLSVKLGHLDDWTRSRQMLGAAYRSRLVGVEGVTLVPWDEGAVHHLLVVRVTGGRRQEIQDKLQSAGVETGIHYPLALSQQPALAPWTRPCPAAESAATEVLSLPMDPLMTVDEVELVCDALDSALST